MAENRNESNDLSDSQIQAVRNKLIELGVTINDGILYFENAGDNGDNELENVGDNGDNELENPGDNGDNELENAGDNGDNELKNPGDNDDDAVHVDEGEEDRKENDAHIEEDADDCIEVEKPKHHKGKIAIQPIEKLRSRQVTFCKRKKTLLQKAKELETLCNANVTITITDENNKTYFYPDVQKPAKDYRTVAIQKGPTQLPVKSVQQKVPNTPKKLKRAPVVHNLPGKKPKSPIESVGTAEKKRKPAKKHSQQPKKKIRENLNNKDCCSECSIVCKSNADVTFRKEKGIRKTVWIKCDKRGCTYQAHASCAGLVFQPRKAAVDHAFKCLSHR